MPSIKEGEKMENQNKEQDKTQTKPQQSQTTENPILLSTNRRVYPSMGHGGRGRKIPRRESLT